ncbi:hypothetical protein [Allomuricauda sp. NBRC 101325]|uniref:hypothetical protein n=1 Tax=Allomuricauda sp. NBRC 101325 TaxID=1113758 RepID=UPI0024A5FA0E|nr:hypothetical protein [Muricauda sp. NBRC 101325]GLU44663.1 hypothetical protein Musp01_22870 [Muricauda sp. NBRC 101325]
MTSINIKSKKGIIILGCSLSAILISYFIFADHGDQKDLFKNEKEFVSLLDNLFLELNHMEVDNLDNDNLEAMVHINENIRRAVENINSLSLLKAIELEYGKRNHLFQFILSPDGKIGVFSWYTKLDASGNAIKNIAIHQRNNKVIPTSLYGDPIIYNDIFQLESNKGQTVYLLYGADQSASNSYQRLNSYLLRDGNLEAFSGFPDHVSTLSTLLAEENNLPNHFDILEHGSKINFRNSTDTSQVKHSLLFNGDKFVYTALEN